MYQRVKHGIYTDVSAERYYPLRRMSKSMLEWARPGNGCISMKRLHEAWEGRLTKEPTRDMDFGNAFDSCLLTPDQFKDDYTTIPDFGDLRKKENKERRSAWHNDNPVGDRKVISGNDMKKIEGMCESVMMHPVASKLINQGAGSQAVLIWHYSQTAMKARLDILRQTQSGMLIIDVKKIYELTDKAIKNQVANFGYHRQCAIYSDAVEILTGEKPRFAFIFVEEHYPHEVRVTPLGDSKLYPHAWLKLGRRQYQQTVGMWEHAIQTGHFPGAYEGASELDAPGWVEHELIKFGEPQE